MDGDKKVKIDLKRIPIVIGITGHRDIRKEDEEKLKNAVRDELKTIKDLCPNSDLVMLNSLARGSDLLCAGVAKKMKIPLYVVLPMEKIIFAETQGFNREEQKLFEEYCKEAKNNGRIFVTSLTETPDEDIKEGIDFLKATQGKLQSESANMAKVKNYLYRQAGIYIVSHCHVLLALWDGSKPKADGCGTAEVVNFALKGTYSPISGASFRSANSDAVIHVFAWRNKDKYREKIVKRKPKVIKNLRHIVYKKTKGNIGNWDEVKEVIKKTDVFNELASKVNVDELIIKKKEDAKKKLERINKDIKDAKRTKEKNKIKSLEAKKRNLEEDRFLLLPEDNPNKLINYPERKDPVLNHIVKIYYISDEISYSAQGKYRSVLRMIASLGAFIALSFLLYDEREMIKLIIVCGLLLAADIFYHLKVNKPERIKQFLKLKPDCHERYLEYRVLAEDLRVQAYLRYAGSKLQVANLIPWTQQEELAWIMDALCALMIGKEPPKENDETIKKNIEKYWVENQRMYHEEKSGGQQKDNARLKKIAKWALLISIILYIITLLFEWHFDFAASVSNDELQLLMNDCRSWLKILLGFASAAAVFAADFYGKLSPERILSDHIKMANFYKKMSVLLAYNKGLPEELLKTLAREMLIENGNWYSYQKDNKPEMNL